MEPTDSLQQITHGQSTAMEILTKFGDHIIVAILLALGSGILYKRKIIWRKIKCYLYRQKECRISFACLLKVKNGDKYLLIRNHNRPEVFGPIGGVYKYHSTAKPFLDKLPFRPQHSGNSRVDNDIRGFIPIENLNDFIKWFDKGDDREVECVTRELQEELVADIKLKTSLVTKEIPKFRIINKVNEGPYVIKERDYVQFRRLDIYELIPDDNYTKELITYLTEQSKTNDNIEWVTADEIKKRRMSNSRKVIGGYCGYLIGKKRIGGEDIHYD